MSKSNFSRSVLERKGERPERWPGKLRNRIVAAANSWPIRVLVESLLGSANCPNKLKTSSRHKLCTDPCESGLAPSTPKSMASIDH